MTSLRFFCQWKWMCFMKERGKSYFHNWSLKKGRGWLAYQGAKYCRFQSTCSGNLLRKNMDLHECACVYNYIFNCITGGRRLIPSGLHWFKNTVQCGDTIIHMSRSTKQFATLCGKGVLLSVPTHDLVHLLWFPAWSSVWTRSQGVPPSHAAATCGWCR